MRRAQPVVVVRWVLFGQVLIACVLAFPGALLSAEAWRVAALVSVGVLIVGAMVADAVLLRSPVHSHLDLSVDMGEAVYQVIYGSGAPFPDSQLPVMVRGGPPPGLLFLSSEGLIRLVGRPTAAGSWDVEFIHPGTDLHDHIRVRVMPRFA